MVVFLRGTTELASWRLRSGQPDLDVIDELARLQLAAKRLGCSVRLDHASRPLTELLDLVGLGEVVSGRLLVEMGGEAEGGEELRVEVDEHGELDDPTV
jgi:hypothetical protein